MARAALKWSAADLARQAAIGYATVARFESGQPVQPDSISQMRSALERGGIEFIAPGAVIRDGKSSSGAGVRLRG
ncbi:XRE family transcriptional regulator [Sphingomonas sp. AAP5]|nr:XRE family transcriptional regulator [Sphingomonas sp. AAP5]